MPNYGGLAISICSPGGSPCPDPPTNLTTTDLNTSLTPAILAGLLGGQLSKSAPTISNVVYTGANNELFSYGSMITTQGQYSSFFSGSGGGIVAADDLYSITLTVLITHYNEGDHSSLDATILVPEPNSFAIFSLGLGLLGLGATARRRGNAEHRLNVRGRSNYRPNRLRPY